MFLEVDFADGSSGKYPFSAGAVVTIQEPNTVDAAGLESPGPKFSFALMDVVGVTLNTGELSPEPAPAPAAEDPSGGSSTEETSTGSSDGSTDSTATASSSSSPDSSSSPAPPDAPTPPAVPTPEDIVAATGSLDTPEEQLAHATALKADLEALQEVAPDAPGLTDAIAQADALIADLTPAA